MTVAVIVGPMFLYKDNQPVPERFIILAAIFAAVGVVCLMLTSIWCKERVVAESLVKEEKQRINYIEVVKEIFSNRALIGCMLASFIGMVGASVVNGLNTYLYKDYFGNVQLSGIHLVIVLSVSSCALQELQQVCLEAGCRVAFNLDGGGSATMVLSGERVNMGSTTRERDVSDIVYIGN